jgi:hypothetical protein
MPLRSPNPIASNLCQCDCRSGQCFPCNRPITQEDMLCDLCRKFRKGPWAEEEHHCHTFSYIDDAVDEIELPSMEEFRRRLAEGALSRRLYKFGG